MNRKLLSLFAAAALAVLAGTVAFAGGVPSIPPVSRWSEPSQILNTLNTFIRTLNGESTDIDSTSGNFSLGKFCTGSSATTAVTCNGARGILTLTASARSTWGELYRFHADEHERQCQFGLRCSGSFGRGYAGSTPTIASGGADAEHAHVPPCQRGIRQRQALRERYTVGFQCFQ